MYGSIKESEDLITIQKKYPRDEIINPRFIRPESSEDQMSIYLKTVKKCDILIVRGIPNASFTAGIGKEINYALENGLKVFEIKNLKFIPVRKPVEYLTRLESNLLFDRIRSNKKYKKYCGMRLLSEVPKKS